MNYQIFLEFIHRVVAGVLGLIFVFWFFYGIIKKEIRKEFLPYLILADFVLVNQIILGRETVTRLLNAYIVKFHLLNAVIFVSNIYYLYLKVNYTL